MATKAKGKSLPPFRVRYPRRMKSRKTYSVQVSWQSKPIRLEGDMPDLTVRLVMPGAQVVPSERPMNPNRPNETATFYVTPLGKGWLRGERLEVLADGKKVQEIALPAKVVTQRLPLVLLALAVLIPYWLITFIQGSPEEIWMQVPGTNDKQRMTPWERHVEIYTPANELRAHSNEWLESINVDTSIPETFWESTINLYNVGFWTLAKDTWREEWATVTDEDAKEQPEPQPPQEDPKEQPEPKEKDAKANLQAQQDGEVRPRVDPRAFIGGGEYRLYLPFISFLFFFVLALLLAWRRREKRSTRVGKPLQITD